jgi:hypothetical protein
MLVDVIGWAISVARVALYGTASLRRAVSQRLAAMPAPWRYFAAGSAASTSLTQKLAPIGNNRSLKS